MLVMLNSKNRVNAIHPTFAKNQVIIKAQKIGTTLKSYKIVIAIFSKIT